ncbi:MAG: hypothetical protein R3C44_15015 [Chloroflexota bacterium]
MFDLAIFAAFLVGLDPHSTGMAIHEWLGLAFGAGIITHLLLHWKWLVASTKRFFSKLPAQHSRVFCSTVYFLWLMTVMIFSGIVISESALPALGLNLNAGFAWRGLYPERLM